MLTIPAYVFGAGLMSLFILGDALCLAGGLLILVSVILPPRRFPPGSRFLASSPFRLPEARHRYLRVRRNVILGCVAFSVVYLVTTV